MSPPTPTVPTIDEPTAAEWNRRLAGLRPEEIIRRLTEAAPGRVIVSTNFRPYEAVILHLCTRVWPEMPVLWVDHGFNRPATYRHAEALRKRLGLNLKACLPRMSAAHWQALYGPPPHPEDEPGLKRFSAVMKLEPFQRGLRELNPVFWITALRRMQNPNRAGLETVVFDANFHTLKVSPLLDWSDADMEAYLREHDLPSEWDYFDPAKADEKRECGLHAAWGKEVVRSGDDAV